MATAERDSIPVTERLRLTEVFHSLQGEADSVGIPTVFVRLTGCPLRCQYCDTAYAFEGGHWHSIRSIVERVVSFSTRYVCVTGGEPLAQPNCLSLLTRLCDAGLRVSLETSGAIDSTEVDPRVVRVLDVKTTGSGESARNLLTNYASVRATDCVKFVVCDRDDYEWAREFSSEHGLYERTQVLLSPSFTQLEPKVLAGWILEDRLNVRFQVQLHKVLWGNEAGR